MFSYIRKSAADIISLSPKVKAVLLRITTWSFFYELFKLLPPFLFKLIIDKLVVYDPATGVTPELLIYLVLGYGASLLVMSIVDILMQHTGDRGIRKAESDVMMRVIGKLLALDISYHERRNTGASVSKIMRGDANLVELLYNAMNNLLPVLFQTVFTLVVFFWIDWRPGLAFLVFVPLFFVVIVHGARRTQAAREESSRHYDEFAGVVTQSLANIRTVKDFGNEEKELEKSRTKLESFLGAVAKRISVGLRNLLIEDILVTIARAATLVIGVYLMIHQQITAGSLVLIMSLSEKAYLNLTRLSRTYYRIQDAEPSITRFQQIYAEPLVLTDNAASTLEITEGKVAFEDVTFSYGGNIEALKGITFTLEPKQTVAFVGRSGSGKTTMAKLVLRLADVTKGRILIDGKDVRDYSFRNLRGRMAIVSQDVELFNETIAENIAYGVAGAGKDEIIRVAKLANAHDFIMSLEKGYETIVGERGVKLSGGQKQRIAIARALLRNPKILIFDEATSSLDAESEKFIHEAIFGLQGKLTLIIIAHRFSTIEHADKIILLEEGKVAEIGTHSQLIAKKGIFAKLRRLQELR